VRVVAFAILTGAILYLCVRIAMPFIPGITWAVALAAISLPLHRWIRMYVSNENWSAALSTATVFLILIVPMGLIAWHLTQEARASEGAIRDQTAGQWIETVSRVPVIGGWITEVDKYISLEDEARKLIARIGDASFGVIQNTIWAFVQLLVTIFILFYCFRDRGRLLEQIRQFAPLEASDTDRVINRADDAIHATVYGTLLIGIIQGLTGGLLFWLLGLPAPVLWGVVMTILSILPLVGVFIVWIPFAVLLAAESRFGAAGLLVGWGVLVAVAGNYLYANVACDRMRMHPVPTLLAFVGGLAVFGLSGMVLGPVILAVAVAILDIWRHRVMRGHPVDSVITTMATPIK
jgi:predicted PurR-regulated permease PerM